jgi:putative IMPACT (imprinted ancient) family translation regulator
MLGQNRQTWRVSDDGEPSGTAGKPILGQINSFGLTNILIIVTRYFGGKLLGVSGLINAYRSASEAAIVNGEVIENVIMDFFELRFPYSSMNHIMKIIKDENLGQSDQNFDQTCRLIVSFRHSSRERIKNLFSRVDGLIFSWSHTI